MKKLFIKTLILCVLIFSSIITLIVLPLPKNNPNLVNIDKHNLLANTRGQKIVLAGGSNLAFGIDSAKIERAMNMPVINMGFSANFGLPRIIADIEPELKSGDILIIAAEYIHFSDYWNGIGEDPCHLICSGSFIKHKRYKLLVSKNYSFPQNFIGYLYGHKFKRIFAPSAPDSPHTYTRDGFNKYGDYINHLSLESRPCKPAAKINITNTTNKYLHLYFNILKKIHKKGVTVLITYPSYEQESFDVSKDFIYYLDDEFRKNLTVISKPQDYRFEQEYIYDGVVYHLNKTGREIRTQRLIKDLTLWRDNAANKQAQ